MKVLIFEWLVASGGGEAPESMIMEGAAMLRAAMEGFSAIAHPFTLCHPSHAGLMDGIGDVRLSDRDPFVSFSEALEECQAILIIAPETGGILYRLASMAAFRGVKNLGCSPEAIEMAGDKLKFARKMEDLRIPHPRTFNTCCFFDSSAVRIGKWISKPVDGAGCGQTRIHPAGARIDAPSNGSVMVQEMVEGEPMSVCVVSSEFELSVLSINRQSILEKDGLLIYEGGEVTDIEPDGEVVQIAKRICQGIPGLSGFWGIDYIQTSQEMVVIEVNPRLTTPFCALTQAIGENPAKLILDASFGKPISQARNRKRVDFNCGGILRS